jgi:RNA polymerase sigma-70 factor (ECF subfamily)
MTADSERELVDRAQTGDEDAFAELVEATMGPVYRMLVRVLGSGPAAEDVTQEAFVRAWRALPSFRGDARFSTWLYRIAMNEANRYMSRAAQRRELPSEDVLQDVPDLSADPATEYESGEMGAELERLLTELPPDYRAAVVLRDVEGLTNEEAAEVLGLHIRNFKSRLHRGRMALRHGLEGQAEQES